MGNAIDIEKKDIHSSIDSVIKKINKHEIFQRIGRWRYLPIDMEYSLKVIESIGKSRISKFRIDDENRFVYENFIRWVHGDNEFKSIDHNNKKIIHGDLKKGIYIAGNTGSGKSWVLEIMSSYAMAFNFEIQFGNNKRPLNWLNIRADSICDEYIREGSIERFKKMSMVGIQDFGAEPAESLYMGNRVNVIKQIFECRGDRTNLITFITSNIPMTNDNSTIIARYEYRVASRLVEMCNYFELKGIDRRKL